MMIKLTYKLQTPLPPATTLTLPWEQRTRSRLRVVLDNGREAGLFLERGTILRGGDLLGSDDGYVVQVRAADEALSTVTVDDALLMARACYHLGNRHAGLEIASDRIRYRHDPVIDAMVRELGLEVYLDHAPFDPEIGAYAAGAHHHD